MPLHWPHRIQGFALAVVSPSDGAVISNASVLNRVQFDGFVTSVK